MIKHLLTGICMTALIGNSQTIVPAETITTTAGNYSSAEVTNLGIDIDASTSSSDEFDFGPGLGLGTEIGYISDLGESSGTITHTFETPISISEVWLWNGYFSFELNHCTQDVTLTFKDETGEVLGTEDVVFAEADGGDLTAEVMELSTEYIGVKEVDFEISTLYGGNDISIRRLGYAGSGIVAGTEDLTKEQLFSVFPNPSNGQFTIELHKNEFNTISIYNNIGEVVYTADVTGKTGQFSINLEGRPTGIYHMQVVGDTTILSEKIIKQ